MSPGEPEAKEVAFKPDPATPGAWTVEDEALRSGVAWRVRAKVGERDLDSQGFEPMYLDLVFSKTPIVPEGDGAKPLEPVELPKNEPPEPAPPPPPAPAPSPPEGMK